MHSMISGVDISSIFNNHEFVERKSSCCPLTSLNPLGSTESATPTSSGTNTICDIAVECDKPVFSKIEEEDAIDIEDEESCPNDGNTAVGITNSLTPMSCNCVIVSTFCSFPSLSIQKGFVSESFDFTTFCSF